MITRYSELKLAGATKEQILSVAKKLNLTPEQVVSYVYEIDPSKKYEVWLLKQMSFKNIVLPEDKEKVQETLKDFEQLSKHNKLQYSNINQYKSIEDLKVDIKKNKPSGFENITDFQIQKYLNLPGVWLHAQNPEYLILGVSDPESLTVFGDSTEWCTRHIDKAIEYLEDGNQFIIFKNQNNKYLKYAQFSQDFSQFQDIHNKGLKKIDTSLANLIVENIDFSFFIDAEDIFNKVIRIISGMAPDVDIPQDILDGYKENLLSLPLYEIDWEDVLSFDFNFRDVFLNHSEIKDKDLFDIEDSLVVFMGGVESVCFNINKRFPRWIDFENLIKNAPPVFISQYIQHSLLTYLKCVEKKGRCETIDNLVLDISYFTDRQFKINFLTEYVKWNDVAGNLKWVELEEFILESLNKLKYQEASYDELIKGLLVLAVEYWILVSAQKERWFTLEPFLWAFSDKYFTKYYLDLGGGESPILNYKRHTMVDSNDLKEAYLKRTW